MSSYHERMTGRSKGLFSVFICTCHSHKCGDYETGRSYYKHGLKIWKLKFYSLHFLLCELGKVTCFALFERQTWLYLLHRALLSSHTPGPGTSHTGPRAFASRMCIPQLGTQRFSTPMLSKRRSWSRKPIFPSLFQGAEELHGTLCSRLQLGK